MVLLKPIVAISPFPSAPGVSAEIKYRAYEPGCPAQGTQGYCLFLVFFPSGWHHSIRFRGASPTNKKQASRKHLLSIAGSIVRTNKLIEHKF